MRTQEQIVARLKSLEKDDILGFEREPLLYSLEFEYAKPFLSEKATKDLWEVDGPTLTEAARLAAALSYLEFAWGKAEDHRGISASRSVSKMTSYAWLLGLDEVVEKMKAADYAQYGCPILKIVSEALGAPMPDGEHMLRMMRGEPCCPGCDMGCET